MVGVDFNLIFPASRVVPGSRPESGERTVGFMTERRRAVTLTLAGLAVFGAALSGAGLASADPADPIPNPELVVGPPAENPAAPDAAPAPAPPPTPARAVPEIPNPHYGSGQSGGGILGTLKDLWNEVQNPTYGPDDLAAPKPPPGAGPAPALPPGYVSTNAPGSETPATGTGGGGPATGRPALPPGYYSIDGPPPPGYEFTPPSGAIPAAPATVAAVPGS